MTEAEWLACEDPAQMLIFLRGKVSERKLRLYLCGCCRAISSVPSDERTQRAVAVGELFADGLASLDELAAAHLKACHAAEELGAATSRLLNPRWDAIQAASVAWQFANTTSVDIIDEWTATRKHCQPKLTIQVCYQRDIFGNPFHPVALDPAWRTATATALADAIYTDRAFDRLPILADALEDAGCTSRSILDHCRQPGEHVRGCWVVDLVLGRK